MVNKNYIYIKALSGSIYPKSYKIDKNIINIGRSKSSDIVVDDKKVSRKHARIIFSSGIYRIEDLGSTNGTYLNGLRIKEPKTLNYRDSVTIGNCKFTLMPDSQEKKLTCINKPLLVAVIAIIVILIPAIIIPTYLYTRNSRSDIDISYKEKIEEEDAPDKEAVEEEVTEELVVEKKVDSNKGYVIDSKDLKIDIYEKCLNQDDTIKIIKYGNNIKENNDAIFGDYGYKIEFAKSDTFKDFIELTINYDEGSIPYGVPESSVFVAFLDEDGNIYYQGGKIDSEANTITVNTIHTSSWIIGWFKDKIYIAEDVVVAAKNYPDYMEQQVDLAIRTFNLFTGDIPPEFNNIEDAKAELQQLQLEWVYKWNVLETDLEEFKSETRSYKDILIEGLGLEPVAATLTAGSVIAVAAGLTATATTFTYAGLVVIGYSALDFTLYGYETMHDMSNVVNKWTELEQISKKIEETKLAIAMLEEEKLTSGYIGLVESEGIELSEREEDNISYVRQSYQESKEFSSGGKPVVDRVYWDENENVLYIEGKNFGGNPTNNEKVRFTYNGHTRNIYGGGEEIKSWSDDLISVKLNWSFPVDTNIEVEVKAYGEWSTNNEIIVVEETSKEQQYREINNISYTIIYGPNIESGYCVYRVRVDITGDYKSIRWNRDDSNGAWGSDVAQINISPGESFNLKVYIDNYFGGVEIYSKDFYYVEPEPETEDELTTAPSQAIYSDGSWDNAVICDFSPPTNPISGAQWIWEPGWPQTCTVSKTFNIDGNINNATIKIAVDNFYILYINGSEVGRKDSDPTWDTADTYNIKSYLHSGSNTVSVNGWNEYNQVGISVKIQIN